MHAKAKAEAGYRFYAALDVVEAKGIASKSCDGVDVLIHHAEQVSIEWTLAKHERPNGLNVWRHGNFRSFRVLDVIWSDGTMPLILAYRGGVGSVFCNKSCRLQGERVHRHRLVRDQLIDVL